MELALKNKEFNIYFHPKINLSTLKIDGAEALIRWIPRNGNIIFPDKFISILESNGFIVAIDFYVFDSVCRLIREFPDLPVISVNLSSKTLNIDYIVEKLINIINTYNISVNSI